MCSDLEAQPECVSPHQLVNSVGGNGIVEVARAVVTDGTEEGAFGIGGVARLIEIVIEERLGAGVHGDVARFATFAVNSEVRHASPRVNVFDLQLAEFLPAEPVVEKGREEGPIPEAF